MICCSHIIFLSFLHQVLPTTTIATTSAPTSSCPQMAVSAGKTCIFPFTYKGVVYYCCSTEDVPDNQSWCPLDPVLFNVGPAGVYWDYCRKFIHKFGGRY